MIKATKIKARKIAWIMIVGSVASCTFVPVFAAVLIVTGVLIAVSVEFL